MSEKQQAMTVSLAAIKHSDLNKSLAENVKTIREELNLAGIKTQELPDDIIERVKNPLHIDPKNRNIGRTGIQSPDDLKAYLASSHGKGVKVLIAQELNAEQNQIKNAQFRNQELAKRKIMIRRFLITLSVMAYNRTKAHARQVNQEVAKKALAANDKTKQNQLSELGSKMTAAEKRLYNLVDKQAKLEEKYQDLSKQLEAAELETEKAHEKLAQSTQALKAFENSEFVQKSTSELNAFLEKVKELSPEEIQALQEFQELQEKFAEFKTKIETELNEFVALIDSQEMESTEEQLAHKAGLQNQLGHCNDCIDILANKSLPDDHPDKKQYKKQYYDKNGQEISNPTDISEVGYSLPKPEMIDKKILVDENGVAYVVPKDMDLEQLNSLDDPSLKQRFKEQAENGKTSRYALQTQCIRDENNLSMCHVNESSLRTQCEGVLSEISEVSNEINEVSSQIATANSPVNESLSQEMGTDNSENMSMANAPSPSRGSSKVAKAASAQSVSLKPIGTAIENGDYKKAQDEIKNTLKTDIQPEVKEGLQDIAKLLQTGGTEIKKQIMMRFEQVNGTFSRGQYKATLDADDGEPTPQKLNQDNKQPELNQTMKADLEQDNSPENDNKNTTPNPFSTKPQPK